MTVGVEQLGFSPVLQSGDTEGPSVWAGVMGSVRHYYEEGGGRLCDILTSYHGEAGETLGRRVMGNIGG